MYDISSNGIVNASHFIRVELNRSDKITILCAKKIVKTRFTSTVDVEYLPMNAALFCCGRVVVVQIPIEFVSKHIFEIFKTE